MTSIFFELFLYARGEELLNLIKQSPKDKVRSSRDDRGRLAPSRELKHKGKSASDLEAQWQKEAQLRKVKEDEARKKEEEERQKEEERLRQEREEKVSSI